MTAKTNEKKNMGCSVFNMDHVKQVVAMTNLAEAKKFALEILNNSTANCGNKIKIKKVIESSRTVTNLAMTMSNHMLAHPGEGLKVI
jgi:hypothetical protein